MSRPLIGRALRRLRQERQLTQQALAERLGISASYLNLIEHDQRAVTASIVFKLTEILHVDIAALSGSAERVLENGLREVFADAMLAAEPVPETEIRALAESSPEAARAVLSLYRAWRVAREDAGGIALPSGRRILLPNEEARDILHDHANHFPALEAAAEAIVADLGGQQPQMDALLAERLRRRHGLTLAVGSTPGTHRQFDPARGILSLSDRQPRESLAFQLAFQVALLETRDAVEALLESIRPSSTEAAALLRIALLNYAAAALLMPYVAFRAAAIALRHDLDALAARFGTSFEQTCQRLSSLQRDGARGIPFFFLRTDPAGNVGKRFSASGFPFARFGGSCPRWVVHTALTTPGTLRVQVAELTDGARFLCMARTVIGHAPWGEPPPIRVVAIGCDIGHADAIVYSDGLDLVRATVGIGLSCRLCDRLDCHSRAFPPLEHRLALDPLTTSASPYRFSRIGPDPPPARP